MKFISVIPGKNNTYDVTVEFEDKAQLTINFLKKGNEISSPAVLYDEKSDMNPLDLFNEEEISEAINHAIEHIKAYK